MMAVGFAFLDLNVADVSGAPPDQIELLEDKIDRLIVRCAAVDVSNRVAPKKREWLESRNVQDLYEDFYDRLILQEYFGLRHGLTACLDTL